ncbi:PTS transporter subunit EIIC, partial [Rhodoferax saidenbachensis]
MSVKSLGDKVLERGNLWLTVVRDSFIVLMPLTFFGLVALLLQFFPWSVYRDAMTFLWGDGWPQQLNRVIQASHGIFGMVLASVVASLLARRLMRPLFEAPEVPSMIVAISALINFMLMVSARPLFVEGLGSGGMLHGIVVGIITAELLRLAFQWRWLRVSDGPYEADSIYHHAVRLTPAVIAAGGCFFLFVELLGTLPEVSPYMLSPVVIWAQLQQTDATWVLSSLAALLNQAAWFFGVHGAKVLDTYGAALFAPIGSPYTNALAWRPLFNHFVLMGGAGSTMCLVIAILWKVRQGPQHQIAKWSVLPALFNINEAVLYGLPIVLNGIYVVPFLCIPLLFTLMTVAATELG